MRFLWLKWLLTMIGFPIGGGIASALVGSVTGPGRGAVAGIIAGAVVGAAQWLVLRQALPISALWIPATAVGLSAGLALGVAVLGTKTVGLALLLRAAVTGIVLGVFQWVLLRQHLALAGWWVPAIAIGWTAGWTLTRTVGVDLSRDWAVFGISGAAVFAALSGLALTWLLKFRGP